MNDDHHHHQIEYILYGSSLLCVHFSVESTVQRMIYYVNVKIKPVVVFIIHKIYVIRSEPMKFYSVNLQWATKKWMCERVLVSFHMQIAFATSIFNVLNIPASLYRTPKKKYHRPHRLEWFFIISQRRTDTSCNLIKRNNW